MQCLSTVDTNDEWIVQRTGVRERRIAKNMHTWELALGAAQDALADAKIDAGELDLILVSTCTPDTNTPNTAAILQDKLGAGAIGAFDINNACTGFVSATDIADCYIKSGKAEDCARRFGRTLSRIVDYTDRGTCILFATAQRRRFTARPRTIISASSPPLSRQTARVRNICAWKRCRSKTRSRRTAQ